MKYWIRAEDFVMAFVGPFDSNEAAQQHIDQVIVPRGDSSTNSVITQSEFEEESDGWLVVSIEDDLAFDPFA